MPIPPLSPPGAGTFGILGGLLLPLSMVLAWRKGPPGPVGALLRAGAVGRNVALKPKTAGIVRPGDLDRFVRSGVIHADADGRYWVDLAALRRSRIRLIAGVGFVGLAVLGGGWILVRSLGLA